MAGLRPVTLFVLTLLGLGATFGPAPRAEEAPSTHTLVVTTSMLGRAAERLLAAVPEASRPRVIQIVPPGACPGHFDLSPRRLPDLRAAAMVVRHDYQGGLDRQLRAVAGPELRVVSVPTPDSLLIPGNFAALEGDLAAALVQGHPAWGPVLDARVEAERRRLENLSDAILTAAKPIEGRPVLASVMQADFCRWLGLDVAAEIARPEDLTPQALDTLTHTPAVAVVANLQSGTRGAQSLARRLDLPLVVLSNFPGVEGYGEDYEALVRENVRRLVEACRKP